MISNYNQKNINELNVFLKSVGFKDEIVMFLDSSFSSVEFGEKRADKIAVLSNGDIAVIESEFKSPTKDAIIKMMIYADLTYKNIDLLPPVHHNGKPLKLTGNVRKIMSVIKPKNTKDIYFRNSELDGWRLIEIYSPRNINGNQSIKTIENKIKNNKKLNEFDYYFLANPLYTTYNMKKEQLLTKCIKIIQKID